MILNRITLPFALICSDLDAFPHMFLGHPGITTFRFALWKYERNGIWVACRQWTVWTRVTANNVMSPPASNATKWQNTANCMCLEMLIFWPRRKYIATAEGPQQCLEKLWIRLKIVSFGVPASPVRNWVNAMDLTMKTRSNYCLLACALYGPHHCTQITKCM